MPLIVSVACTSGGVDCFRWVEDDRTKFRDTDEAIAKIKKAEVIGFRWSDESAMNEVFSM
jgi:hypothetical protein